MEIQIETTLERDIDLLIMEEFISAPEFARIFLDEVGIREPYVLEKAIHSKTDSELGESDLVFILNMNGVRYALHIEDKIDALAMSKQHERYVLRAKKDVEAGQYDTYSVLIVAPKKYLLTNEEAQKYEHRVQYEQLQAYFQIQTDDRSKYKLALIQRAIMEQKNGYQWKANPRVVQFCTAMNAYQKEHYPGLPTGTIAWWPSRRTLIKGTDLVFKANKGFCDLSFRGYAPAELYKLVKDHISERMFVVQTGKSSSVRISVTPIWFENCFQDRIEAVDEALQALNELYELSKFLII